MRRQRLSLSLTFTNLSSHFNQDQVWKSLSLHSNSDSLLLNSTAATWALFALAENVEIQSRLRTELLTVDSDNPSMDELNALPYLDCVVRETLRADPPVPAVCA